MIRMMTVKIKNDETDFVASPIDRSAIPYSILYYIVLYYSRNVKSSITDS
jgi:hypothetical protein